METKNDFRPLKKRACSKADVAACATTRYSGPSSLLRQSHQFRRNKSKTTLSHKEIQLFQDRFMLTFWLHYPVRNDLQNTRIIARHAFNALPREEKQGCDFGFWYCA